MKRWIPTIVALLVLMDLCDAIHVTEITTVEKFGEPIVKAVYIDATRKLLLNWEGRLTFINGSYTMTLCYNTMDFDSYSDGGRIYVACLFSDNITIFEVAGNGVTPLGVVSVHADKVFFRDGRLVAFDEQSSTLTFVDFEGNCSLAVYIQGMPLSMDYVSIGYTSIIISRGNELHRLLCNCRTCTYQEKITTLEKTPYAIDCRGSLKYLPVECQLVARGETDTICELLTSSYMPLKTEIENCVELPEYIRVIYPVEYRLSYLPAPVQTAMYPGICEVSRLILDAMDLAEVHNSTSLIYVSVIYRSPNMLIPYALIALILIIVLYYSFVRKYLAKALHMFIIILMGFSSVMSSCGLLTWIGKVSAGYVILYLAYLTAFIMLYPIAFKSVEKILVKKK